MFIGRRHEITLLRSLKRDELSRIAILYGRQRVGKTALIQEAFKDE